MIWTPRVTVAAVIEQDDKFLLVEELIDDRLVLNQPAGHLEAGESLQAAVVREVWEETARYFTPTAITGIYRWPVPEKGLTYLRFCFSGSVSERQPAQDLDEGIVGNRWFDYESLQNYEPLRSPMVLQCIYDYKAGPHAALEMLHEVVLPEQ